VIESLRLFSEAARAPPASPCQRSRHGSHRAPWWRSIVGFRLAQALPILLVAALLFLSPMSFLISAVRNAPSNRLPCRPGCSARAVAAPGLARGRVDLM